jgi:hypothetical protein
MRLGPSLAVIALAVFLLQPTGAETGRWFEDVTEQAGVARPHANRVFENRLRPHHGGLHGARRRGRGGRLRRRRVRRPLRHRLGRGRPNRPLPQQRATAPSRTSPRPPASPPATTRPTPRPTPCGSTTTTTAGPTSSSSASAGAILYRNLGDGTFEEVTEKARARRLRQRDRGDRLRLRPRRRRRPLRRLLLRAGRPLRPRDAALLPRELRDGEPTAAASPLYRNDGGRFTDVTEEAGLAHTPAGRSTSGTPTSTTTATTTSTSPPTSAPIACSSTEATAPSRTPPRAPSASTPRRA